MLSSTQRERLGQALGDARRKAGITQAELADATGLTQATVSRLEAGDRLSLHVICVIARELGVKVSAVFKQAGL